MRNTQLWNSVYNRAEEINFKDEDIKKLSAIIMYMNEQQNRNIDNIKGNVRFFFYLTILSIAGFIVSLIVAANSII